MAVLFWITPVPPGVFVFESKVIVMVSSAEYTLSRLSGSSDTRDVIVGAGVDDIPSKNMM